MGFRASTDFAANDEMDWPTGMVNCASGPGTFVVWVNCDNWVSNTSILHFNGAGTIMRTKTGGELESRISSTIEISSGAGFGNSTWYMVTVRWSAGTGGTMDFLNGLNVVHTDADTGNMDTTSSAVPRFGQASYDGRIAYAQYYDVELTDAQIQEIYYRPGSLTANLQAYGSYLLDSDTTQYDLSGNGNDIDRLGTDLVPGSEDGPPTNPIA